MNDFTKGYMRGYKDAQKEALSSAATPCRAWVNAATWRGLTDEDLANCDDTELKQALYWEQILKEKNNVSR